MTMSSTTSPTAAIGVNVSPTNNLVRALLTDLYQLTMTYSHWKIGKVDEPAVFELFFRKNPFKGQYTIFCGLDESLKLLQSFQFTQDDIEYLKSTPALEHCEKEFFDDYLLNGLNGALSSLKVYSVQEGTVVFPKCPLMIIEGTLGIGHLLETTLLNLINYPSLIATNASRMVLRANANNEKHTNYTSESKPKPCLEFGLRRAQGPDGACTASKYSYVGGFVGTSNVQAGKMFGIPISGTHAHSYVQSFTSLDVVSQLTLYNKKSNKEEVFLTRVLMYRTAKANSSTSSSSSTSSITNDGELAAFCAYACTFPNNCLCLIDTYDTIVSGLENFIFVAKALDDFGYVPKGVRLDSGDLAALSAACQHTFQKVIDDEPTRRTAFTDLTVVASNDINEATLVELSRKEHGITAFGIGTNLVTCQAQPALGCVYKLVQFNGEPRIKLSQELVKVTIPGVKRVYRFFGGQDKKTPLLDYMCLADEDPPTAAVSEEKETSGGGIICRHPFRQQQRLVVFPSRVEPLHRLVFDRGNVVDDDNDDNCLSKTRTYVQKQLHEEFSDTITRYDNPKEYDVMVSPKLYKYLHELWEKEAPIEERR